MVAIAVMAAITQIHPGPMDGFRANLSACRVGVDFECHFYKHIDYSRMLPQLESHGSGPGPADEPSYIARGRWEFDGSCERYVTRYFDGVERDRIRDAGTYPPAELIWEGETYAYHYFLPREGVLHVELRTIDAPLFLLGPFTWERTHRFDREIDLRYANAKVERKSEIRGGRRLECEIYETVFLGSTLRFEIAYDPNTGYLPRFARSIAWGGDEVNHSASVLEFYFTDSKACRSGGLIPTEWYRVGYDLDDFERKYPGYNDETRLTPSGTPELTHFRVLKMEDQEGPVKLVELAGVTRAWAPGGFFEGKEDLPRMSMADLRKKLGKKMIPTNASIIANIDSAELHEFDEPRRRTPWFLYLGGGLTFLAVVWIVRGWGRWRLLLVLMLVAISAGCGARPISLATVAFTPDRLIYDASRPSIRTKLIVNNAGNRTLQIFSVDAGCSCRPVDQSKLPARLRPGENLPLTMSLSAGPVHNPLPIVISLDTDHGKLTAQATLLALPDHFLTP